MSSNDWVTITSFTYPHEAALLKARLESEGFECNIKDDALVSVNPLYSNALGGVKVQVLQNDVIAVIPILRELGYKMEADGSFETSVGWLTRNVNAIPFLQKYSEEKRLTIVLVAIAVALGISCAALYYIISYYITIIS